MKRDERKDVFFFLKNVSRPSNPPDELARNVSKKIPSGRIILHFSSKAQNLTVFSIIYMIRIRFSGRANLIRERFRAHGTWFDSGHMFCDSTVVAMDVFHTFSPLRQTRILKCCSPFCCRTEKRAQSMLLVAVLLCAVRTWKTGSTCPCFTWLTRAIMDSIWCRGGGSTRESDSGWAGTDAN